jgi:hypothetical protein
LVDSLLPKAIFHEKILQFSKHMDIAGCVYSNLIYDQQLAKYIFFSREDPIHEQMYNLLFDRFIFLILVTLGKIDASYGFISLLAVSANDITFG